MTTNIALLFPGQGSQSVEMGKSLYETSEDTRNLFKKANQILNKNFEEIIFNGPKETLTQTENAQPAIFLVSVAMALELKKNNITPNIVAGHSLGEITAYHIAGCLDLESALNLIKIRGEAMGQCPTPSGMAAVMGMDRSTLESILDPYKDKPVVIANDNCPGQIVISGEKTALSEVITILKEQRSKVIPLKVSGAFHSPLMNPASEAVQSFCETITFNKPHIPIVLNRTAQPTTDDTIMMRPYFCFNIGRITFLVQ